MVTIRNTNDSYGDPIEFIGDTLAQAVAAMQQAIRNCGQDYSDVVITDDDYDMV